MESYESARETMRENMQEDDPGMDEEVTEGIFSSSSNCEPKKKEEAKKKSGCGCKTGSSKGRSSKAGASKGKRGAGKGRSSKKSIVHYNPFIVFYLETYWEHEGRKVTEIAKCAAKIWCKMSDSQRAPYIKIAREESARRARMGIKTKRRKKC